tara:strand:- start:74 stop:544 length:471 start_codon:yes stop_codon:yes gene_type:complete
MNTLCKKPQQLKRRKGSQRGFTLVELMMATAIGSLIIIGVLKVVDQAKVEGNIASLDTQIASFAAAAERYKKDNNNQCTGLTSVTAVSGFYVPTRVFEDNNPWGGVYGFRPNAGDGRICEMYAEGMPLDLQDRLVAKYTDMYRASSKTGQWIIVQF